MKIPGPLALVSLALSLVAPAVAQPKDPVADPQTTQKIRAISQAYNEAINRNDAAAVHGRQAIEKWYADLFEALQPKERIGKPEGEPADSSHVTDQTAHLN